MSMMVVTAGNVDGATNTGSGISLSMPVGDMSLTVGSAATDDGGTEITHQLVVH